MHVQHTLGKDFRLREFKEFDKKEREKIAHFVESSDDDLILSKMVDGYVYGTTRALDFGDYFGSTDKAAKWEHAVNKNSDYFDITEMEELNPEKHIPRYMSFRTAAMYKDHQSQSLANSIGLIFDAYIIKDKYDDMHVTTLFGIDKEKEPTIARLLTKYPDRVPVSMGCSIKYSFCTVCGHEVKTNNDQCDHLRYARGGRRDGKKVAEFLKGVDFYELSVVNTPACPTAYVIDAISEIVPGRLLKVASELDEGMAIAQVMSSVHRMIKNAKTIEEKRRLSIDLDRLYHKLEQLS